MESTWKSLVSCPAGEFVPLVHPKHAGLFNTAELENKVKQDVGLAFGLIAEYCILLKKCSKVQAEHGLIHGIREQMQQDRPLFWLAFAVQIFVDIQNILQTDITRAFEDLYLGASSIRHSIKEALDFEKEASSTLLTDSTDKSLEAVLELMDQ